MRREAVSPGGRRLLCVWGSWGVSQAAGRAHSRLIAQWCERNPQARMIVIDVFAKMRGTSAPGSSAYDADYAAVGHAKRIADCYGIAIVLVHHVRKAGSDDFLAEVSGTNGLAGAADATLVLKRPLPPGRGRRCARSLRVVGEGTGEEEAHPLHSPRWGVPLHGGALRGDRPALRGAP
ncbi:AAA family ATPase [Streptomyces luteolus]|uniref:AAA family ATPase n=1 Tax=Streptomyces luteolus TaxID=3043615 RepID=UPI0038D0BE4B